MNCSECLQSSLKHGGGYVKGLGLCFSQWCLVILQSSFGKHMNGGMEQKANNIQFIFSDL